MFTELPEDKAGEALVSPSSPTVPVTTGIPTDPLFDPPADQPDLADMPGDPRDQLLVLAYWRARGIRPPWAHRVTADRLVTLGELRRAKKRQLARADELETMVFKLATEVARLKAANGGR